MKNIICTTAFILLLSCSSQKSVLHQIQGTWSPGVEQNVSFIVKDNHIIYPEDEEKLDFKINNNSLELSEEGHAIAKWKIIKVTSDSLVIETEDAILMNLIKITK